MKKTYIISSIKHFHAPSSEFEYESVSISQNAKWLCDVWDFFDLECTGIQQHSEEEWRVTLKGRKKNINEFVCTFLKAASELYTIRET